MLLINVFIKKLMKKSENYQEFYSNVRSTSSHTDI